MGAPRHVKETMTPRERWLAVLNRKRPDRIPMDYWATPEVTDELLQHLRCEGEKELWEKLHIDKVVTAGPPWGSVLSKDANWIGPNIPDGTDVFGCRYNYYPLAEYKTVDEIKRNYKWPSLDWYDYSKIPGQIAGWEDYPIQAGGSEPFLVYKNLRGDEQAFMDLILNPEIVHYCLDKLFEFCYENTHRIYEQIPGKSMLTYVAEDLGSQENLMYSPDQIREFFIPRMKKIIDLAHSAGAFVFHHNDGAIRKIIPDMIEAGIDILNPIQWKLNGMDRNGLKKDFGDKLIFHGAVDNQHTLPFGSKEEVRQEVIENIRILGSGGGYILAPCHMIQPGTPMENIVEMYETGYEYGWQ